MVSGNSPANIQIVTVERQKIEQKVLSAASDRATINNAIEALKKPLKAVKQRTQDLEMQQVMVDNEFARVKIDALNTKAHNDQLKETLRRSTSSSKSRRTSSASTSGKSGSATTTWRRRL